MGLKTVLIITWQDVYVASQHAKGGEDMITVVNIVKKKSYSQADNRGWDGGVHIVIYSKLTQLGQYCDNSNTLTKQLLTKC